MEKKIGIFSHHAKMIMQDNCCTYKKMYRTSIYSKCKLGLLKKNLPDP